MKYVASAAREEICTVSTPSVRILSTPSPPVPPDSKSNTDVPASPISRSSSPPAVVFLIAATYPAVPCSTAKR